MSNLQLIIPVISSDNRVICPAGTELTDDVLNDLVSLSGTDKNKTCSLLKYGTVRKDLLKFLSIPPYSAIFSEGEQVNNVLNVLELIETALPVVQSLDFFIKHDLHTYKHILVVFALSTLVARDLVSDDKAVVKAAAAGPTHDLGKICVPLDILKKTTPLTRKERNILHQHTLAGYALLSYYLRDAQNLSSIVARDHHERRNGSGYPRGIIQSDRMIEIVAACDIYDALISSRPYRPASFDNRTALEEMDNLAEKGLISKDVVQALVASNRSSKPSYTNIKLSTEKRGVPPKHNVYGQTVDDDNEK
jgi:HD-GYP domain-containing protein (c-di-GMP phosphodiesterase class II)